MAYDDQDDKASRPLTEKEERLCVTYIANGQNKSDAYRVVYSTEGMTDQQISSNAWKKFARPRVAARVDELRGIAKDEANAIIAGDARKAAGEIKRVVVDEGAVLAEAARIGLSDPALLFDADGSLLPVAKMTPIMRAAIASVETETRYEGPANDRKKVTTHKVKLWDKNAALEKLMKHLGMFERDNRQRAGLFDKVPKEELDQIVEYLRALERPADAGPAISDSASRFTH